MMLGRGRLWFWMGSLLIIVTTVTIVVLVVRSKDRSLATGLVGTLVAVATAAAGAAAWLRKQVQSSPAAQLPLEQAADNLAAQLHSQWAQVAAERRLMNPIPVQWRWSRRQVTGPIAEAIEGPFRPLPGRAAITVKDLQSGTLENLLGVYGGLGSGRLVVLGEVGAGKSSAGIRLLRDALEHRATVTATDRARVPVPVLVTPRGWDPDVESFAEWLAARLARDYALLRAPEYGEDAAMRLITGGHLAVILDGFDEIPEALRPVALRALDEQATFRLVVLARSEELVAAVRDADHHLRSAAALGLQPIGPKQVADYLTGYHTDPLPLHWQYLIDHLREHPDGVLAQALKTPLTLTLVRDTYGPEDPVDELIDPSRFATRKAIEDHLLDRVLTAAYAQHPGQPNSLYTVDQARRWLGQLARRMNKQQTHDLTWWQIPRWVPAWPRAFATVAVMSAVFACLVGSLTVLADHRSLLSAFQVGYLATLVTRSGDVLGLAFMFGPGLLLLSSLGGGSPQQRGQLRWSKAEIVTILLLGFGVGFGLGLVRVHNSHPKIALEIGLEIVLLSGLVSSLVIGLGFVLGGGPPQQLGWLPWRRTDTHTNLRTGVVIGLTSGLAVGLVSGLEDGLVPGHENGLRVGLVFGFIVGIGYMLVIVLGGRSSPRQDQPQWGRTGIPPTLLTGLVIAIATKPPCGIIYILIVILGGRLPLQRSRFRWSRTTNLTTLLAGLMSRLLAGLMFGLVLGLVYGLLYKLAYGLAYGARNGLLPRLLVGLTAGLLLGFSQPPTEATSPLDPQSLWRRERQLGLGFGLMVWLVLGLEIGLSSGLQSGFVDGLKFGLVAGLGSGLVSSVTWTAALARVQLWRRGEAPISLLSFLDDAHKRQILRTVGPAYQFRDARLQDRLAATC